MPKRKARMGHCRMHVDMPEALDRQVRQVAAERRMVVSKFVVEVLRAAVDAARNPTLPGIVLALVLSACGGGRVDQGDAGDAASNSSDTGAVDEAKIFEDALPDSNSDALQCIPNLGATCVPEFTAPCCAPLSCRVDGGPHGRCEP